jgi:hypothetical protein
MIFRNYFIFIIIFAPYLAKGQLNFKQYTQLSVSEFNKVLPNALAGGLNCPQYNAVDLNQDSYTDLVIFDRIGNHIYTFLNNGIVNNIGYTYSPIYEQYFPNNITDWLLLRDYNCDGIMDIFGYTNQGIQVFKGDYSINNNLYFTKTSNLLYAQNGAVPTNVFVSGEDIPAIDDIDNDGDLDILAMGISGTQVVYYKSLQIETFGHCNDSLMFILDKFCWGKIEDTIYRAVKLNVICNPSFGAKHTGNTLTTIDIDGDGDKDCLKGTVAFGTLNMLFNGGNATLADIISQDTLFPSNTTYFDNYNFGSSFFLDINNDSKLDLVAACNDPFISNNLKTTWYYENVSNNDTSKFELITDSFMNSQMIDVGEGSYPAVGDIDGDGLADFLIGNYGYFKKIDSIIGTISFYKNVGSLGNPIFQLQTKDWLQLSQFNKNNLAPSIADLNNDGLQDIIIGEQSGELIFIENSLTGFLPAIFLYKNIDVGTQSTPQLVDIDEDGDFDLIIGNATGKLSYYQNIGTANAPTFQLQTNNFGNVNVTPYQSTFGYATPHFTKLTTSSNWVLFCGNVDGHIAYYNDISNNLSGSFKLADSMFANIKQGYKTSVAAYDWLGTDTIELLIGNYRGGINMYKNSKIDSTMAVPKINALNNLKVFPNPSVSQIELTTSDQTYLKGNVTVQNLMGQAVYTKEIFTNKLIIPTNNWGSGSYWLIYKQNKSTQLQIKKLVILH